MARIRWITAAVACAALGVALLWWRPWNPWVEVGGMRINPHAQMDQGKTYNVVVWDYEIPIPWSDTPHRVALEKVVKELEAQYPNIKVELVTRDWNEGDGPLRDSFEKGTPPDVLGMPGGIRLIDANYQVPLEHFINTEEKSDIFASARRAATQESLWAFPRWIGVSRWVIRTDRWLGDQNLSAPESSPPTLTATQWEDALANARTKGGSSGLAVNALDPAFFRDLMVSATGRSFLGPQGDIQWSEESIRNVISMLQTWVNRGLISKDIESAARNRLARFWSGNAVAIAPTTPWLMHHILQRSGSLTSPEGDPASPVTTKPTEAKIESNQRGVVWTTPPILRQEPAISATVSGYGVFRQAQYKGHDHTQAAVTVARVLSKRMGLWEASHLFAVPAYPSLVPEWLDTSRLPKPDLQALMGWSAAAVTLPIDDSIARLEERIMMETTTPNLVQVLKGQMTADEFVRELLNTPVSAAAEVAVQ